MIDLKENGLSGNLNIDNIVFKIEKGIVNISVDNIIQIGILNIIKEFSTHELTSKYDIGFKVSFPNKQTRDDVYDILINMINISELIKIDGVTINEHHYLYFYLVKSDKKKELLNNQLNKLIEIFDKDELSEILLKFSNENRLGLQSILKQY